MKIYVDELPKSCDDCEFGYFYDCQYCTLRPDLMRKDEWCEKEKHCPLGTTQSLKQQVRKEVCDEIRSRFLATCQIEKGCDTASFSLEVLNRILDQIQESQGEKK